MSKPKKPIPARSSNDVIVVRVKPRTEPDLRRIARAVIRLAFDEQNQTATKPETVSAPPDVVFDDEGWAA